MAEAQAAEDDSHRACGKCGRMFPVDELTYEYPIEGFLKGKKVSKGCYEKALRVQQELPPRWVSPRNTLVDADAWLNQAPLDAEEEPTSSTSPMPPMSPSAIGPRTSPMSKMKSQKSMASVRSQSALAKKVQVQTDLTPGGASKRGQTLPAKKKSQATVGWNDEASIDSDSQSYARPEIQRGQSVKSMKSTKSHLSGWRPQDDRKESLPQKEKYKAGDKNATGDWPQSQGKRPEDGDMSEFEGPEWEDFSGNHKDIAELIHGCAEALGAIKAWENQSESLLKQMRQKSRGVPKEVLNTAPGRKQVILFLARIAARRPIYRRQAAELQELFFL